MTIKSICIKHLEESLVSSNKVNSIYSSEFPKLNFRPKYNKLIISTAADRCTE